MTRVEMAHELLRAILLEELKKPEPDRIKVFYNGRLVANIEDVGIMGPAGSTMVGSADFDGKDIAAACFPDLSHVVTAPKKKRGVSTLLKAMIRCEESRLPPKSTK